MYANEAYTYYVALIADVAFQMQDELFENYIGCKTYQNDERLKMILDKYKEVSDKHYEWYSNKVTEPAFYADLRDGAQEYLKEHMQELFNVYTDAFKASHCSHSRMLGMCAAILVAIMTVKRKDQKLREEFKKVGVQLLGTKEYLLSNEFNYVSWILDNYGKNYSKEQERIVNDALHRYTEAVEPSKIIKASAEYAFQFHPDKETNFKRIIKAVFNLKWK